jgi:hypothetical protein
MISLAALERTTYDPEALHAVPVPRLPLTGCRLLLWGILIDLFDVRRLRYSAAIARKQYERDVRWITADSDEPFSFLWVCANLGIDPEGLRTVYFSDRPIEKIRLPVTTLPGCKTRVARAAAWFTHYMFHNKHDDETRCEPPSLPSP